MMRGYFHRAARRRPVPATRRSAAPESRVLRGVICRRPPDRGRDMRRFVWRKLIFAPSRRRRRRTTHHCRPPLAPAAALATMVNPIDDLDPKKPATPAPRHPTDPLSRSRESSRMARPRLGLSSHWLRHARAPKVARRRARCSGTARRCSAAASISNMAVRAMRTTAGHERGQTQMKSRARRRAEQHNSSTRRRRRLTLSTIRLVTDRRYPICARLAARIRASRSRRAPPGSARTGAPREPPLSQGLDWETWN